MKAGLTIGCLRAVIVLGLSILYYPPAVAELVNINTGTQQQLDQLHNIGPARANAIIQYREQHGPFQSKEDIMKVPGIGKGIYEGLKDSITVGASIEARAKAASQQVPVELPEVFSGGKHVQRGCWSCKNNFFVPESLKKGWCPFCGKQWSVQ